MYFRCSLFLLISFTVLSCTQYRIVQQISSGEVSVGIAVSEEKPLDAVDGEEVVDSVSGNISSGPILMNAIRDTETGEMVATDVIKASTVTAR